MKKTLIILATLALCLPVAAETVSREKARKVAASCLKVDASSLELDLSASGTMTLNAVEEPDYYLFSRASGGFVIVAGDDALTPVLAYSTDSRTDGRSMPPALRIWLSQVSTAVRMARRGEILQAPETRTMWEAALDGNGTKSTMDTGGKLLNTAKWSQEDPYNLYCPTISGESGRSMTGCVATAIGIVLRYHEWPPCGKGTIPAYSFTTTSNTSKRMPSRTLGYAYDYSLMPTEDLSRMECTSEQKNAVARLLYDMGIMMEMEYSYDGSGAYTSQLANRLNQYMYYQSSASLVYRENYTDAKWTELLKNQIDEGLPLLYGADAKEGGHQFIVCGYDSEDKFFVNWGWGGDYSGYFALNSFYPYKGTGYEKDYESDCGFYYNHDAVINLRPDKSVTPEPSDPGEQTDPTTLYIQKGTYGSGSKTYEYYGLSVSSGTIAQGSTFNMWAGLIYNYTGSKYSGQFGFYHCSSDGTSKGRIDSNTYNRSISNGNYGSIYDIPCTVTAPIELGDKIKLYYKTSSGSFEPVPDWNRTDGTVGELPMIPMYFIDKSAKHALTNSYESYESVKWTDNGDTAKVVISYTDGSRETIIQE